jgi:phosphate:Na+ symporter
MLKRSVSYLSKMEKGGRKNLLEEESIVDRLAHSIIDYLTKLSQETLTDEQSEQLAGLMHAVNDVERIGDHAENIMYLAANKSENGLSFSDTAKVELESISTKVFDMYEGIIDAFSEENTEKAKHFQSYEPEIDHLASQFRRNHIKRLNTGECNPTTGVIFLDVLSNLERVGDLANNVGHVTTGMLERL